MRGAAATVARDRDAAAAGHPRAQHVRAAGGRGAERRRRVDRGAGGVLTHRFPPASVTRLTVDAGRRASIPPRRQAGRDRAPPFGDRRDRPGRERLHEQIAQRRGLYRSRQDRPAAPRSPSPGSGNRSAIRRRRCGCRGCRAGQPFERVDHGGVAERERVEDDLRQPAGSSGGGCPASASAARSSAVMLRGLKKRGASGKTVLPSSGRDATASRSVARCSGAGHSPLAPAATPESRGPSRS